MCSGSKRQRKIREWIGILMLLLALFIAPPPVAAQLSTNAPDAKQSTPQALTPVVFLPHWIPQAQFAGYYMALEKDFYQKEGLDVTILDGGPNKPVDKALKNGETTFASHFLSSALKLRDEGMPVVHLAQITQRSALLLVARKSSGIHSVQDLDGKRVSLWSSFSAQPNALFRKYNLHVETITQGPTINLFLRGGVDAVSAMWYNEYHLLLNSGLNEDEMTVFFYDKYDLNFPEDCLICTEQTWRTRPDDCRKFVRASLAGWDYVQKHREEALQLVMRRITQARTGSNRAHQRWMLNRMCELITPVLPGSAPGDLAPEAYATMVRELKNSGEITNAPSYENFHVRTQP
jgi:NitT/TauT family transport system substrate-binding protein